MCIQREREECTVLTLKKNITKNKFIDGTRKCSVENALLNELLFICQYPKPLFDFICFPLLALLLFLSLVHLIFTFSSIKMGL